LTLTADFLALCMVSTGNFCSATEGCNSGAIWCGIRALPGHYKIRFYATNRATNLLPSLLLLAPDLRVCCVWVNDRGGQVLPWE
jgi:hypothetical protein